MLKINISSITRITNSLEGLKRQTLNEVGDFMIDEAEKAFKTRSFDGKPWKKLAGNQQSSSKGNLVRSLRSTVNGNSLRVSSSLVYSDLQNLGGRIKVSDKMRKMFWSKYYQTENQFFKNAALTKKTHFEIPAREYLSITSRVISFTASRFKHNFNNLVRK